MAIHDDSLTTARVHAGVGADASDRIIAPKSEGVQEEALERALRPKQLD